MIEATAFASQGASGLAIIRPNDSNMVDAQTITGTSILNCFFYYISWKAELKSYPSAINSPLLLLTHAANHSMYK